MHGMLLLRSCVCLILILSRPNLVNDLMRNIETQLQKRYDAGGGHDQLDLLLLRRSLEILNGLIKEFTSFKMLQGVKTMLQV